MALPAAPHSTPGKSAGMTESESKDQPISPSPQVSAASPTGLLKSGTWFPVQTLQTSLFLLSPGRGWGCPFSGDTVLLSCSKTPHHGLNKVPSVLYTMRPILELQTGLPKLVPPIVFPTSVNGLFIPSCTLQKRKSLFLYSMFTPLWNLLAWPSKCSQDSTSSSQFPCCHSSPSHQCFLQGHVLGS